MKRILAALLLSICGSAYAGGGGLVTVYFDTETWEIEGPATVGIIGGVGDFSITGEIVVGPAGTPPSDTFSLDWSGVVYSDDPMVPPVTVSGCRLSRLLAASQGNVLVFVDCRDGIFFNGFESPVKTTPSPSAPTQSKSSPHPK